MASRAFPKSILGHWSGGIALRRGHERGAFQHRFGRRQVWSPRRKPARVSWVATSVREVIPTQPRTWNEKLHELAKLHEAKSGTNGHALNGSNGSALASPADLHVVALDYGMKWNILRHLAEWDAVSRCCPAPQRLRKFWLINRRAFSCRMALAIRNRSSLPKNTIRGVLGKGAGVRHLPGTSIAVACMRSKDIQA